MSNTLAYVPDWRGDETLYSWAATFHATLGNGSAHDTALLLFGTRHACKERDAPPGLNRFVSVTRGGLGSVESLLLTRTPLGQFVPFLPSDRQAVLSARLTSETGLGWKLLCGMPASSLSDPSTLRYCEACVYEDLITWGLPRWRLPHQLAGVWVCLEHGQPLRDCKVPAWQWTLPPRSAARETEGSLCPARQTSLMRVARLSSGLFGVASLDIEAVRQTALAGLRDQSITSWVHPLSKEQLASWFAQSPISAWLRVAGGASQSLADGHWVYALLRNRLGDHPLKWLLLWCTLFAEECDEAIRRKFIAPEAEPHWDADGQGNIWSASHVSIPPDIHRIVVEAATLEDAAKQLGLTVFSLRRRLTELGTNPGQFRLVASFDQRKQRALASINDYIALHPTCSKADVHRDCKAAVAWIRANAPQLLDTATQRIPHRRSGQQVL
jgi:hypothetical protein